MFWYESIPLGFPIWSHIGAQAPLCNPSIPVAQFKNHGSRTQSKNLLFHIPDSWSFSWTLNARYLLSNTSLSPLSLLGRSSFSWVEFLIPGTSTYWSWWKETKLAQFLSHDSFSNLWRPLIAFPKCLCSKLSILNPPTILKLLLQFICYLEIWNYWYHLEKTKKNQAQHWKGVHLRPKQVYVKEGHNHVHFGGSKGKWEVLISDAETNPGNVSSPEYYAGAGHQVQFHLAEGCPCDHSLAVTESGIREDGWLWPAKALSS